MMLDKEIVIFIDLDNGSVLEETFTIKELAELIAYNVPYEDLVEVFAYMREIAKQREVNL